MAQSAHAFLWLFLCVFALWLGGYMALIFHILNKKRGKGTTLCVPGSVDAPAHEHRESSVIHELKSIILID